MPPTRRRENAIRQILSRGTWRALDLDGKALFFDRNTGVNVLVENDKTRALVRRSPRMIQVALTNACNKTCSFCYRPLEAKSRWSFDDLVRLAEVCDQWGILEIAFGGGEPTLFPRFPELLHTIWERTGLCPSFTTNGLRLTREYLRSIRGAYGQMQISFYEEDDTFAIVDLLAGENARFGINYLVTPKRARTVEADVYAFAARGVRDFLFLSYKGDDPSLHLSPRECAMFDESLAKLHATFGSRLDLKVDVCWANRLVKAPQLLYEDDCQANVDFLSITSDKRVLSCSFKAGGIPFSDPSELPAIYTSLQRTKIVAEGAGCARREGFGFDAEGRPTKLVPDVPPAATKRTLRIYAPTEP